MATADHDRQGQAAQRRYRQIRHSIVEFASMTLISARDSAHDFIVKFSPSVCVAVVTSFTGEMAT